VKPEDCLVFEDSFSGIESGTRAGMRVIGLSTTNPEEKIKDKVYAVIHDFKNVTEKELSEWL
jgi:beta-phosphoglucomutase-like phosphatase (HAD superfamily)